MPSVFLNGNCYTILQVVVVYLCRGKREDDVKDANCAIIRIVPTTAA